MYIFNRAEPEAILIPKGYEGEVIIIFDQKEGAPIKYEGKERIYEIPDNGVLVTQFAWTTGFTDRKFYYVSQRERENIEMVRSDYKVEQDGEHREKVGVLDKRPFYYGCSEDGKDCVFHADRFIVSRRKNFEQYSVEDKLNQVIEARFE
ncbi:hypothetical protein GXP67_06580 [Rhodocytophaga rosea]|uniref:DUF6843 domain-containing protein n=1 Tax=Rhodocytophaga rosea TaxID=2704465 RepID=A0A6C0GEE9_9BACT|nr:hypothetical protein [Rhodocytophaga rosea]QHT66346.1 hypothetical protein GXP67_06580 [Rhodocytophaga rosea]